MEKAPSKRYSDVHSFINALAEAVGKASVTSKDSARAVAIYVEGRVEAGMFEDRFRRYLALVLFITISSHQQGCR